MRAESERAQIATMVGRGRLGCGGRTPPHTRLTALDLAMGTVDRDLWQVRISGEEPTPPFSRSGVPRRERRALERTDAENAFCKTSKIDTNQRHCVG